MRRSLFTLVFAALALPAVAFAGEATIDRPNQYPSPSLKQFAPSQWFESDFPWEENTLTGDWGGLRTELAQRGVVFDLSYASLMFDNTHGGMDTGFFGGGPVGLAMTMDMERLVGLEGGMLLFDWEFNHWLNHQFPPNGQFDPTGSYGGMNAHLIGENEAELNQVAQLYYQQSLFDDRLAVTFGKMDANGPFSDIQAASPFQNSLAAYSSTLNPFLPAYRDQATGLVVEANNGGTADWKFGWFDGTTAAFDPVTGQMGPATGPRGPGTFFDNDGHWFLITQADWMWNVDDTLPGTIGVGAWGYVGLTSTGTIPPGPVRDVPGAYLQWQQTVWAPSVEIAADGGGVIWFGQAGWSDPHKNPVTWSLMSGFSATGIMPRRPADAVGIMWSRSVFSHDPDVYNSEFRDGQAGPAGGAESSLETFSLWQSTSWMYIQSGVMWIGEPGGGDPAPLDDALLVYLLVGVQL